MNIVKLENVCKSFNGRRILKNINFSLKQNEIAIIKGCSGAGKSTFLNILLGLMKADEGTVKIFDEYIQNKTNDEFSRIRMQKIEYMTQEDTIISSLSLYENIAMPAYISRDEIKINISDYIQKFNLSEVKNSKKESLSGGERRKLMFIRSLVNMPELLILDEPTSSLDGESVQILLDEINNLKEKMSIIIVTHDERIKNMGTEYLLEDGNLRKI